MIEGAGYFGKKDIEKFKKETSIDLVSAYYRNIERITKEANAYSQKIASLNFK